MENDQKGGFLMLVDLLYAYGGRIYVYLDNSDIAKQNLLVLLCQSDAEIGGGRVFAYAAFLVRHRNHFAIRHLGFSPLQRFSRLQCGGYVEKTKRTLAFYAGGRFTAGRGVTFSVERFPIHELFC